jgi:hypothetical protein
MSALLSKLMLSFPGNENSNTTVMCTFSSQIPISSQTTKATMAKLAAP